MSVCLHNPNCPGFGPQHDAGAPAPTPSVDLSAAAERDRIARSVPVVRTAPVGDLEAGLHRNTVGMALALNGRNIYAGTVSGAEKAKRRAVGKRQRAARKGHRS